MKNSSLQRRRLTDRFVRVSSAAAALAGCLMLGWILLTVVRRGLGAMDWSFFTQLPTPPGVDGGGLANAIVGTLLITALAVVLATPLGLMAGVYLAEFGRGSRLAGLARFSANTLMGVPSIIVGLFVYALVVVPMKRFSGYAGSVALALIMLPVVARTTEDMLAMAPNSLREAAMALGAPRWRVILGVVFRSARGGLLTGVLLALARITGETAPLLFTALNSPYWMKSLDQPTANLPVTIFSYAMSPYENWQRSAWAASLLIMAGVLALTITARVLTQSRGR